MDDIDKNAFSSSGVHGTWHSFCYQTFIIIIAKTDSVFFVFH
jgi:hypothetical protein